MTIRRLMLGGGSLAGLLLGWTGAGDLSAQPSIPSGPHPSAVQSSPSVQRNYLNKRVIKLPIQIAQSALPSIKEIQLYVKDNPASAWVLREKAEPKQDAFNFQAPADGEYWFAMVTVDKQGRCYPADLRNEPPGLAVIIDTQAPVVEMTSLGATAEGQIIQVDVADANLDQARVRFSYQAGDKQFRILEPAPGRGNIFCIPAQAVCTGLVQLVAEDMAGNQTVRQEHLSRMKNQKTETASAQPAGVNPTPVPIPEPRNMGPDTPKELPKNVMSAPPIDSADPHRVQRVAPSPSAPERPGLPRPDGSEGPRWIEDKNTPPNKTSSERPVSDGGVVQTSASSPKIVNGPSLPSVPATTKNVPQKRQIINSTKLNLNYDVENAATSSVAKVEVWLTRDGQSWQKHCDVNGHKSPIDVQLPGDGIYGLMLVASSGTSAAVPPAAGDQPDMWVEVDTTKPTLQINEIQTIHDKGQTVVQIRWTAQDKNLADQPVDLFYAATPQGPWLLIAKGLPGEGQHRWTPPAGLGSQTHLQLIARDAAGNSAVCGTLEPVSIAEPARPRIQIRTISTGGPQQ